MNNPASFRNEARFQGLCAVTGEGGDFDPHHVIYRQHLRKRGLGEWDPRGALRVKPRIHHAHHHAGDSIPTKKLKDCNIEYAFEVMGDAAIDYLRRYYDDSDADPRIAAREAVAA